MKIIIIIKIKKVCVYKHSYLATDSLVMTSYNETQPNKNSSSRQFINDKNHKFTRIQNIQYHIKKGSTIEGLKRFSFFKMVFME